MSDRAAWLEDWCPRCGAAPGSRCRSPSPGGIHSAVALWHLHPARGWRSRSCPTCQAIPGETCRARSGRGAVDRSGRPVLPRPGRGGITATAGLSRRDARSRPTSRACPSETRKTGCQPGLPRNRRQQRRPIQLLNSPHEQVDVNRRCPMRQRADAARSSCSRLMILGGSHRPPGWAAAADARRGRRQWRR